MKNKKVVLGIMLIVMFTFSMVSCSVKTINSPEALKEYLDKQPDNGPFKPIKVKMNVNDSMLPKIAEVIKSQQKFVSLDISGNALTSIPEYTFWPCDRITSITIPKSVNSIGRFAFNQCSFLEKVTFQYTITSNNFHNEAFLNTGDLREKYLVGGPGTYTRPPNNSQTWTKQ